MVTISRTGRSVIATVNITRPLRGLLTRLRSKNLWQNIDGVQILKRPLSHQDALIVITAMGQQGKGLKASLHNQRGYASGLSIEQKSSLVGYLNLTEVLPFKLGVLAPAKGSKDKSLLKICQQS